MAWIELHQAVPTHHKTLALADALAVQPVTAMGHVCCLWLWAVDNAPDGNTAKFPAPILARAAQWDGDPRHLVAALKRAGFLDRGGAIHDWQDYTGKWIERRRIDARRKRDERQSASVPGVGVQRTSLGHPMDVQGTVLPPLEPPLGPDRTGPDRTTSEGGKGGVVPMDPAYLEGVTAAEGRARGRQATPAAVAVYARSRHTTLPDASARLIADTVGTDAEALDRWRRVVEACEANGIGTRNVACALDWYANGIPPKYRVGGAPPTPPPQEVPELRQPTPEEEAAALAAKESAREQLARRGLLRQFDQIGGPPP